MTKVWPNVSRAGCVVAARDVGEKRAEQAKTLGGTFLLEPYRYISLALSSMWEDDDYWYMRARMAQLTQLIKEGKGDTVDRF